MDALYTNLTDFLAGSVFAFILVFARFGTALMIMPGIGDAFVSQKVRLLLALSISFALFPVLIDKIPYPIPGTFMLFSLIVMEFIVGMFIGTIARIFMAALDTAGMTISIMSGLGNAQVFNPSLSAQGSLIGAFMTMVGVLLLFVTNMHHLMILGLFESYDLFPVGAIPDTGSMAEIMARAVGTAFITGVQIATPFIVITLMIYVGMGVLSRLMPQIQVFILALPIQILIALTLLSMVLSAALMYWLRFFEQSMIYFLKSAGG